MNRTIECYLANPEKYVHPFDMKKSRRTREFVSYADEDRGGALRNLHAKLLQKMEPLPSSPLSYAYKKGLNTKSALLAHAGSVLFIKLDIHQFFDSITEEAFTSSIDLRSFPLRKEELSCCFHKGHLPLGFVTSPKLSDVFMKPFDEAVEEYLSKHPQFKFCRYCDDMLLSSVEEDFTALRDFAQFIKTALMKVGLTLNERKTIEFSLCGDKPKNSAVHFLGLNLVKDGKEYRVTLSKGVILKNIDLFRKAQKTEEQAKEAEKRLKAFVAKVRGTPHTSESDETYRELRYEAKRLAFYHAYLMDCAHSLACYIRYNSDYSYQRFLKKYKNAFGKDYGEARHG